MDYDLVVIGAGWAGFNAAIAAARLGKKVCLIESREIGGTCLNRGCIPTKTFVHHSRSGLSLVEIQKIKADVVARLRSGMTHTAKALKVELLQGAAKIESRHEVRVDHDKGIKTRFILIASGSVPISLPGLECDHKHVLSSDDLLSAESLPKSLLVVGGGVIGCEFASIFNKLGSRVTVVELMPQLLPGVDAQVSQKLLHEFSKAGIEVHLSKKWAELKTGEFDRVLLAVGRRPLTEGLWQEGLGIKIAHEAIAVDRKLRTGLATIFAAGDCIGGAMLAHVASYQAELAVANMFGRGGDRDDTAIPSSVFTDPPVASVGFSEQDLQRSRAKFRTATVHFLSIGMAHVMEETRGFAKVHVENGSRRILGASIIGLEATEIVNTFSLLIKNRMTIQDVRRTVFAHPSASEIIAEVAKSFD